MWQWEKIGGTGSLGADKIVVAAIFDGGVAIAQGRWDWKTDKIVVAAVFDGGLAVGEDRWTHI